eukprot:COSAG03_NODE_58_length_15674_cov_4.838909_3_plen_52_part_00
MTAALPLVGGGLISHLKEDTVSTVARSPSVGVRARERPAVGAREQGHCGGR